MSDSTLAVQSAVLGVLSGALSEPVYDHVPQDEDPVYVQIGSGSARADDTKTGTGVRQTIEINVFSQARGLREVKTLMSSIYNALHRQRITVTGFDSQELQFEFSDSFIDPRGARGVMRFSIPTQPE